jgi:exodeoxyribonuclease VII small subunit
MNNEKQETYKDAIEELEKIVKEIEDENIEVDMLTEKVKRASYLIKLCKNKLKSTDDEVKGVLSELEKESNATPGEPTGE